jgi:hypothetical protein
MLNFSPLKTVLITGSVVFFGLGYYFIGFNVPLEVIESTVSVSSSEESSVIAESLVGASETVTNIIQVPNVVGERLFMAFMELSGGNLEIDPVISALEFNNPFLYELHCYNINSIDPSVWTVRDLFEFLDRANAAAAFDRIFTDELKFYNYGSEFPTVWTSSDEAERAELAARVIAQLNKDFALVGELLDMANDVHRDKLAEIIANNRPEEPSNDNIFIRVLKAIVTRLPF